MNVVLHNCLSVHLYHSNSYVRFTQSYFGSLLLNSCWILILLSSRKCFFTFPFRQMYTCWLLCWIALFPLPFVESLQLSSVPPSWLHPWYDISTSRKSLVFLCYSLSVFHVFNQCSITTHIKIRPMEHRIHWESMIKLQNLLHGRTMFIQVLQNNHWFLIGKLVSLFEFINLYEFVLFRNSI